MFPGVMKNQDHSMGHVVFNLVDVMLAPFPF